jgi:hypothetical protein
MGFRCRCGARPVKAQVYGKAGALQVLFTQASYRGFLNSDQDRIAGGHELKWYR